MNMKSKATEYLNYILEDDDESFGGTEFADETLKDFIESLEKPLDEPMSEVNLWLKECGIKPIKVD